MMNSHGVAAAFAVVSGLVLLADKPKQALAFVLAAAAIEAVHAFKERKKSATHIRFRDKPPAGSKIIELNWRDNPFFPSFRFMSTGCARAGGAKPG